jgi:hypothetical protein
MKCYNHDTLLKLTKEQLRNEMECLISTFEETFNVACMWKVGKVG